MQRLKIKEFQEKVWNFYKINKRSFAWREDISPYRVLVSEIMLQQTQTARVVHKFAQWIQSFSSFDQLAQASQQDVLMAWQGLGYNRRGLALHAATKRVVDEFGGVLPDDPDILQTFKGIGLNTAGSICAFAFNKPVVFIETNIRTVFLHEFFKDQEDIHDKQLLSLIEQALDYDQPRDWYYALMDYGVYLKKEFRCSNAASRHYAKQSKFIGSKRQLRGAVVRVVSAVGSLSYDQLCELIVVQLPENKYRVDDVLPDLVAEGFVSFDGLVISAC